MVQKVGGSNLTMARRRLENSAQKEMMSQTNLYLVNLSSKTYGRSPALNSRLYGDFLYHTRVALTTRLCWCLSFVFRIWYDRGGNNAFQSRR